MTDQELKTLVASLAIGYKEIQMGHKEIQEQQKHTDQKLAELIEQQKKTDAQLAKTDAQLAKTDAQLAKTDARLAKTDGAVNKLEKAVDKLQKTVRQVSKNLGEMGNIQGDVAEDLFRRNLVHLLKKWGIKIDQVDTHLKTPRCEYDVVGRNGSEVVVLEVKNKLTSQHIQHFLLKQLPLFKQEFPMFARYKVYGAVGSLIVNKQLEQQAAKAGLFILTQTKKGGANVANPVDFKAKVF